MVGRLISYWKGNFSGSMLNFGRVNNHLKPRKTPWNSQLSTPTNPYNFPFDSSTWNPLHWRCAKAHGHKAKGCRLPRCNHVDPNPSRMLSWVFSRENRTGWWLNQPIVKNMNVKMGSSSPNSGENQQIFELPPPSSNTSPLKEVFQTTPKKERRVFRNYHFCQGLSNWIPGSNSTSEGLFSSTKGKQTST